MNLFNKLRIIYRENLYGDVSNFRGAWRVKKTLSDLAQRGLPQVDEEPRKVFEEDWDNLFILDACRHDLYEEVEGETDSRISIGSRTPEYISETFSEGDFSDVVYITGNPYFSERKFQELTGRSPDDVFHTVFHTYMEYWDDDKGTILPEPLIDDAKTARKLFPDKRIVVHFMQPHIPFVKSSIGGKDMDVELDFDINRYSLWQKAEKGLYDRKDVWDAYRNNLGNFIDEIKSAGRGLDGKTAITSDHGNFVGENGLYGHQFPHSTAEVMRKVPWDIIED